MNAEEVMDVLKTNSNGLTEKEAKERQKKYGKNEIKEKKRKSPIKIFFDQFKDFLIIILIAATIISFAIGEIADGIIILVIVLLCATLSFIQEYKSEKAIEALKRLAAPTAKVIRNGKEIKIPASDLVPGDIIVLETGDKVPADCRIIEEVNLQIDESVLTGESNSIKKITFPLANVGVPIADRKNMAYSGTVVTYGHGKAVVVSIGMETEFGKIAGMIQEIETEKTPLEVKLEYIGRWLGIVCLGVCFLAFLVGIMKGYNYLDMFIWGVSLAVAAVPEALPAVVTGALAIGTEKMARNNAIVKRLPAVETLGCTTVICSDKTGTLTKNEMTVRKIFVNNKTIDVSGEGYKPEGKFFYNKKEIKEIEREMELMFKIAVLCNDSILTKENNQWKIIGDPTEAALVVAAKKAEIDYEELRNKNPRIAEIPFDMVRKRMTTIHPNDGRYIAYVKGAPEIVLDLCSKFLENGKIVKLTDEKKKEILKTVEKMGSHALRVLAFAYRDVKENELTPELEILNQEKIENDLIFVGLMGMIDPPRQEAKSAIEACKSAGIKPIIVTGDHAITTLAIAKEIGLVNKKETLKSRKLITDEELEKMSDEELEKIVENVSIFARVSPHHKLRIVNVLKNKGHVVAMTGDGINDAPALKSANIGVAMGISGTDVTKEAADMILMDDNFSTIVKAIEEGRVIYDNIKKYLTYLIRCNIGEILVLTSAFFLGLPVPLIAIQILMINLITDGLPALALGVDPPDPDVMKRKPRKPDENIFSKRMLLLISILVLNMFLVIIPLFNFYLKKSNLVKAQTVVFSTMVMFELFNAYNSRSDAKPLLRMNAFKNKWLNLSVLFSLVVLILIIQVPFLSNLFHTTSLTLQDYTIIFLSASSALFVSETFKFSYQRLNKLE